MQKSEKALLLIANIEQDKKGLDYRIEEILNLCDTGKVDVEGVVVQNLKKPQRSYIGSGKLNESKREAKTLNVDLIIVDDELSPNQQKYLEDFLTLFKNFLFETISITVFPTTIANGFPPKVDP